MNRFRGKMCARAYTYKWDFLWHSLPNVQRQTKWKIIGIGNLMCVVRLWNSQCVRIFVSISQLSRQNQILCHCRRRRRRRRYHHQPESHSTNLLSKKIIQTKANADYVISKSICFPLSRIRSVFPTKSICRTLTYSEIYFIWRISTASIRGKGSSYHDIIE